MANEKIENVILASLVKNEDYARQVLPFLKTKYFDPIRGDFYKLVLNHITKYNKLPSKEEIAIELDASGLNETKYAECYEVIEDCYNTPTKTLDRDWLLEKTENWCKDRAVYHAVMDSINIINNRDEKRDRGCIPELLNKALGVSFDRSVGHSYLDDSEKRYSFYTNKEERIPFDLDAFNKITGGGIPRKTLNIAMAGCVRPDTRIKIRYKKETWIEQTIEIKEIENMLEEYDIQVDSPDGWVGISEFVKKGLFEEYCLEVDGVKTYCNQDHKFETNVGWKTSKELLNDDLLYLTKNGFKPGKVSKTGQICDIVDIQVEHENHRYYTNNVSSHNTGAGKSLCLCHMAAGFIQSGYNVLYITMEMAEERIAERIDANLLDINIAEIKELEKSEFLNKMKTLKKKTQGNLVIKEYPTSSAHSGHFRALIKELQVKKDFKPDVLIVDYLNICSSSRIKGMSGSINSYTYIKAIAEELRGLSVEFNVATFSATQVNRTGYGDQDVELTNTSECIEINQTVKCRDGSIKLIKDVKPGDQITANDEFKTVMKTSHIKKKECFELTTKSGKKIVISGDHVFPTNRGRISINTGLKSGDKLLTL